MGNVLELLGRIKRDPEPQRIVMLGLDAAGKSTILYSMNLDDHKTVKPTIGFNVEEIKISGTKISFVIWDLGGQESLRVIWRQYLNDIAGLIYVVDSSDVCRLEEARRCLQTLIRDPNLAGVPIVVVANKQDLHEALSIDQIENDLGLKSLSSVRNPYIMRPTIALTGQGVLEMFVDFAALVKSQAKRWNTYQRKSYACSLGSDESQHKPRLRDRIQAHMPVFEKRDQQASVWSV